MSVFSELKRRNVFRVAALYLVSAWVLLQVGDLLFGLILRTHWVLVVMDQFTRRIIGFGVRAGVLDGLAICRKFNRAIAGRRLTAAACISYPWLRDLPEFATDTLRRRSLPTVSGMICSTASAICT